MTSQQLHSDHKRSYTAVLRAAGPSLFLASLHALTIGSGLPTWIFASALAGYTAVYVLRIRHISLLQASTILVLLIKSVLGNYGLIKEAAFKFYVWALAMSLYMVPSEHLIGSWIGERKATGTNNEAASTDPGLLAKYTTYQSYHTRSGFSYPKIRTFYSPHPQAHKLPADLPLLVFIHGLGGSVAQFAPLLTSLVNVAPCLAIDLPGCGLSDFRPDNPKAYTIPAFAELVFAAIDCFRGREHEQKVIIIGHSMGCSIGALLVSSSSPPSNLLVEQDLAAGLIAICPKSSPPTPSQTKIIRYLRYMPAWLFDLIRLWDKRGDLDSASIARFVGKDADVETRKLQLRFNEQSRSDTFLRILTSMGNRNFGGSFPGKEVWSAVKVPLFLTTGEDDHLNTPAEVEAIAQWLAYPGEDIRGKESAAAKSSASNRKGAPVPVAAGDIPVPASMADSGITTTVPASASTVKQSDHSTKHAFALKTTIFPPPASHGLMYATSTVRILSGLIQDFLTRHVDERLSMGWQLRHMTTSGKWDVKNLAKWQSVDPCSEPIGGDGKGGHVFRAMKTMREVDEKHSPREFVAKLSSKIRKDGVAMVVDISHESPVYDPKGLEDGGVEYHKFPTVSKLPPTADEVEAFIGLIDRLRESPRLQPESGASRHATIAVHCHYGFNRTGFFIVCYMIERLGYRLQDALEEFAQKRSPGIKHEHFVNELHVRYAVKMERRGTLVG